MDSPATEEETEEYSISSSLLFLCLFLSFPLIFSSSPLFIPSLLFLLSFPPPLPLLLPVHSLSSLHLFPLPLPLPLLFLLPSSSLISSRASSPLPPPFLLFPLLYLSSLLFCTSFLSSLFVRLYISSITVHPGPDYLSFLCSSSFIFTSPSPPLHLTA